MKEKIVGQIVSWNCSIREVCIYSASRKKTFFLDFSHCPFTPFLGGVIEFDVPSES